MDIYKDINMLKILRNMKTRQQQHGYQNKDIIGQFQPAAHGLNMNMPPSSG